MVSITELKQAIHYSPTEEVYARDGKKILRLAKGDGSYGLFYQVYPHPAWHLLLIRPKINVLIWEMLYNHQQDLLKLYWEQYYERVYANAQTYAEKTSSLMQVAVYEVQEEK